MDVTKLAHALKGGEVDGRTPLVPPRTTEFSKGLEGLYRLWSFNNQIPQSDDYDMRGFYLGGLTNDPRAVLGKSPFDGQVHFEDKWKLPNHQSFSQHSQYSRGKSDPNWIHNPAPYKEGTWGLLDKGSGYRILEIPK